MKLMQGYKMLRAFGPKTVAQRIYHAFKIKSGLMERIDAHGTFGPTELSRHLLDGATPATMLTRRRAGEIPFFFQGRDIGTLRPILQRIVPDEAKADISRQVEDLKRGRLRFYSRWDVELGDPINWRLNPVENVEWPNDKHWCRYSQFDPRLGDLKMVWEAGRFSQCFLLTRAFALTGNIDPLQLALRRIREWIDANPPVYGVQWGCGQEAAFRLMAWLFALHAAYGTELINEASYGVILASIYRQAQRIEHHIGFSRSLRNNHSLSEALGLYTVGLLFPEFDQAVHWRRLGLKIFVADAMQQIAPDGSFIQNSMNYHRILLHDCLWMVGLGQLHGERFPPAFLDRVDHAAEFIYQMHNASSGRVPNYGANDGARVLQLDSCDYADYRPAIQASWHLMREQRVLDDGPWNEMLLWFRGKDALRSERVSIPLQSSRFDAGGYYTLRGRESWGMIRCHTHTERPVQPDMLHLDLWWRGENVLHDNGTYKYHCEAPWDSYFKTTRAHNTIAVDGLDQLTKGPRFMWFDWTKSRLLEYVPKKPDEPERWSGEHYGYVSRLGVTHRRSIERSGDDQWRVTDELLGTGRHEALLSWHLGDWSYEWRAEEMTLELKSPVGMVYLKIEAEVCESVRAEVVRGLNQGGDVHGWESVYYGEKLPIPVLRVWLKGACPMRVVTHIGLGRKIASSSRN